MQMEFNYSANLFIWQIILILKEGKNLGIIDNSLKFSKQCIEARNQENSVIFYE